ncbi:MAG: hypothetical protein ACK6A8_13720, partial [Planctomycetota bacterium]
MGSVFHSSGPVAGHSNRRTNRRDLTLSPPLLTLLLLLLLLLLTLHVPLLAFHFALLSGGRIACLLLLLLLLHLLLAHLVLHPPGLALLLLLLLTHGLFLSCLLPAHRLFGAALLIGGLAGGLLAGPTLLQFLVALLALLLLRSQAVVAFQFPRCGIFPRRGIGRSRFGEQAAVGGRQRIGATGGALLPFALTSRGFLLPSGVAGCITSLLSGLLFGLASRV